MQKESTPRLVLPPALTAQFSDTELQNRQAVIAALKSIQAGDAEPFWALFDPDVEFHEAACLPYGGVHKGVETARRAHASIRDYFELSPILKQVLAGGDLGALVLQREIDMARWITLQLGDLAPYPHAPEIAFQRALHRAGNFRNGVLWHV